MLSPFAGREYAKIYLACGATDLRKSIDSLAAIVTYTFELDPFAPGLFVFCNRGRDKLKILFWENNGFWLYYRRLEKGRFQWPQPGDQRSASQPLTIDRRQLQWLLDGLDLEQNRAHRPLHPTTAG